MRTCSKFVAIIAATCASGATLASVLHMDVNALRSQSRNANGVASAFGGLNHTGSISLTSGPNSVLADLILNSVAQNIAPGQLQSFAGSINLVNGGVTGGSRADADRRPHVHDRHRLRRRPGREPDPARRRAGLLIDGLTTNGVFSTSTFAGANIAPWFNAQPLTGSFINFGFNPNSSGLDTASDLDIFLVPTPAAGGVFGLAALGLGMRRRRA